jgi:hypothetical protein
VTILQLRGVSLAIKNSSTIALPKWYEVLESLGLMLRIMPRDVSTRWNSTYDMVEFATEYRAALDIMTADRNMNLRKFELSKKEWGMTTELCEVLQVCPLQPFFVNELIYLLYQIFKHGTLFFSRDSPNISTVIPAMDHIDEYLMTACRNMKISKPIRAALALGRQTLNHYYNKTDHSDVYRIAMGSFF